MNKQRLIGVAVRVIALTTLLVAMSFSLLNILSKDAPPPNDKDLQLAEVVVPAQENAYYDLIKLGGSFKGSIKEHALPIANHLAGKQLNEKLMKELIARNKEAFEHFDEMAKKPRFQDTSYNLKEIGFSTSAGPKLPPFWILVATARLISIQSGHLFKQGREREALEEAIKIVEVGQKLQNSQGGMLSYFLGVSLKGIGLERTLKIIESTEPPSRTLVSLVKRLEKLRDNAGGMRIALKLEYMAASNEIDFIHRSSMTDERRQGLEKRLGPIISKAAKFNYYFEPNKTRTYFSDRFLQLVDSVEKPCGFIAPDDELSAPWQSGKIIFTENAFGKFLYDTARFDARVIYKRCEADLLVSAVQIAAAIKTYYAEKGSYPDSLAGLVPQYIPRIPLDPYDGKPIRYLKEKKIIYSVGKDSMDAGGSVGGDWRDMKDPTFKVSLSNVQGKTSE